ncbi:hypothetical protein LQ384_26665 [Rhodococcus rhodochrous]|uniref:DUF385 domain-containing protein n=1 Tax=Rhodococcus rhodochrous TaxID=1829 RepID=A0AAW4XP81_RHORH|nr:hypothetical protein [Rhodococcus rhodochrous]MCD2114689.1 hypothetical protein [Rhodococcus rhodochrous]
MTIAGSLFRLAGPFNSMVMAAAGLPVIGNRIRNYVAPITYKGRKSGRTITLPISYRRSGDSVTIGVAMPDEKSWWRNFLGAGAPMSIELDEEERTGHAVATRDERGRVEVVLQLDPA